MKKIIPVVLIVLACILVVYAARYAVSDKGMSWNQLKWKFANNSHYRFNYSKGSIWGDSRGCTIEVQDGNIISAACDELSPITIDELFSKLRSDIIKNADEVTVTYNPTYGFPSEIYVNPSTNMSDEEYTYYVSRFEILP